MLFLKLRNPPGVMGEPAENDLNPAPAQDAGEPPLVPHEAPNAENHLNPHPAQYDELFLFNNVGELHNDLVHDLVRDRNR